MPSPVIKFVAILMLILILTIHGVVIALSQPKDKEIKIIHGVKVVLNEPGLKYYWDKFKSFKNIVPVNYSIAIEAYAYRSHYDPDITITMSLQSLQKPGGKDQYLTITALQLVRLGITLPTVETSFNLTYLKVIAQSLNWNVTLYYNVSELRKEATREMAHVEALASVNESIW